MDDDDETETDAMLARLRLDQERFRGWLVRSAWSGELTWYAPSSGRRGRVRRRVMILNPEPEAWIAEGI